MPSRACPLCFVRLPRSLVLARSDELVCPSCRTELELSRRSRVLAAFFGLVAAYVAVQVALAASPKGTWFIALVAAVLAYGLGSALLLYFASDLVVCPKPTVSAFPQTHQ